MCPIHTLLSNEESLFGTALLLASLVLVVVETSRYECTTAVVGLMIAQPN